ncbi:metal-dependent hydrolase [Paenibacillus sp. FA6]|uniref:metal-dependent hydrolase n=1 Tax=Paenibacillus sp. FA6 TaxID=3413029 RepID=UPI003F65F6DB
MKGSTHLAIGTVIGIAAAMYHPFSVHNTALYIAVSAFSALSADLDGNSILSSRIGKFSKQIRQLLVWGSLILTSVLTFLFLYDQSFHAEYSIVCLIALLFGFITKEGMIRNALISAIGGLLMYGGWHFNMNWLIGLGLFIAWAPWLKHRGMTHTVWALCIWGMISYSMEQQLQVDGLMAVATTSYLSHLLADTLTPQGVKWLYPLYKRSIKLRL